jgi:hypothetical protein
MSQHQDHLCTEVLEHKTCTTKISKMLETWSLLGLGLTDPHGNSRAPHFDN